MLVERACLPHASQLEDFVLNEKAKQENHLVLREGELVLSHGERTPHPTFAPMAPKEAVLTIRNAAQTNTAIGVWMGIPFEEHEKQRTRDSAVKLYADAKGISFTNPIRWWYKDNVGIQGAFIVQARRQAA